MAQQNQPNQQAPLFSPQNWKPQQIAQLISSYVRAAMSIGCSLVLAALTLALVWLALRGIWWGMQLATEALGLGT